MLYGNILTNKMVGSFYLCNTATILLSITRCLINILYSGPSLLSVSDLSFQPSSELLKALTTYVFLP